MGVQIPSPAFKTSQISEKTLDQNIQEELKKNTSVRKISFILDIYVKEWNQNKQPIKILPGQKSTENLEIVGVKNKLNQLVSKASTNFLTYENKNEIEFISNQLEGLSELVCTSTFAMAGLVSQQTKELAQQIEIIEQKVDDMSSDVKQLLPPQKTKHNPRPLRDPINFELF